MLALSLFACLVLAHVATAALVTRKLWPNRQYGPGRKAMLLFVVWAAPGVGAALALMVGHSGGGALPGSYESTVWAATHPDGARCDDNP